MSPPSILVIDGNRHDIRDQQVAAGGAATGEAYARTLASLAAVRCDIVHPADGEVRWSQSGGVSAYDGVAITGSALAETSNAFKSMRTLLTLSRRMLGKSIR